MDHTPAETASLMLVGSVSRSREAMLWELPEFTLSLQLLRNCLVLINTLLVERTIEREGLWERLRPEVFGR